MIAVRTYTTVETALVNCIYYHRYSEHRCNLATDQELSAGVYGYTDMEIARNSWTTNDPLKQHGVMGVLCGYL